MCTKGGQERVREAQSVLWRVWAGAEPRRARGRSREGEAHSRGCTEGQTPDVCERRLREGIVSTNRAQENLSTYRANTCQKSQGEGRRTLAGGGADT